MCQRGAGTQNTPSVFGTVAIREARAGYTVAKQYGVLTNAQPGGTFSIHSS